MIFQLQNKKIIYITKLQSIIRGYFVRKHIKTFITLQSIIKGYLLRKKLKNITKIQAIFRSYLVRHYLYSYNKKTYKIKKQLQYLYKYHEYFLLNSYFLNHIPLIKGTSEYDFAKKLLKTYTNNNPICIMRSKDNYIFLFENKAPFRFKLTNDHLLQIDFLKDINIIQYPCLPKKIYINNIT